jgi:hypothetical protein
MNGSQQSKGHQLVPIVKSSSVFFDLAADDGQLVKACQQFRVGHRGRRHFENNAD